MALLCGLLALLMGLYSVCVLWRVKRVPICSCSWWLMSRGDGSGRPALPDIKPEEGGGEDGTGEEDGEGKGTTSDLEMKDVGGSEDGTTATNLSGEVV